MEKSPYLMDDDEVAAEIRKCAVDPIYFIEKYCFIELEGKSVPFKLFDYQKRFIKFVLENKYVIVNKSRQLGMSQTTGALMLWYSIFRKNKEVVVVSLNDKEAMYFLEKRVKRVFEKLPSWLVGAPLSQTEHKIKFDTGSVIEAVATTKKSLRGRSPSMVLIDEVAFHQWAEELISSALPSLQLGEHLILISTPNGTSGIGKYFYETWTKAVANESEFKPFEIKWWECPLYNPEAPKEVSWEENIWALKQYKSYANAALFRQEILGEWIMAGETVLPPKILDSLSPKQPIRCDFIQEIDYTPEDLEAMSENWDPKWTYAKGLWIWKDPEPNHHYVAGVDLSTGRGDDYTAVQILDINTMEQVAEYRNKIPTSMFADLLYNILTYYNNAFVAIETNSDESVINKLADYGYDNIYYRVKGHNSLVPGWNTNLKTRGLLVSYFQDVMINSKIKVYSYRLINECKAFVWENGKAQAAKKANDDLVFAFMIASYVIEDYISRQGIGINIREEDMKETKNILLPISERGFVDYDMNFTNESDKFENTVTVDTGQDVEIDRSFFDFVGINGQNNGIDGDGNNDI